MYGKIKHVPNHQPVDLAIQHDSSRWSPAAMSDSQRILLKTNEQSVSISATTVAPEKKAGMRDPANSERTRNFK